VSRLARLLAAALGGEVRPDAAQRPATIGACAVPRMLFAEAAAAMKEAHALLVAEWAADESAFGRGFAVFACYRWAQDCLIVRADLPAGDPSFPTLTGSYAPAFRFERQMRSLMGVVPAEHPDGRPWIAFEDWPEGVFPLRKGFDGSRALARTRPCGSMRPTNLTARGCRRKRSIPCARSRRADRFLTTVTARRSRTGRDDCPRSPPATIANTR
jgi:Ni,Fe-hydrogenase III component G